MRLTIPVTLALCLSIPATTHAQEQVCGKRATLLAVLALAHSEVPIAMGLAAGGVVEIIASPDGATWTALLTRPDGLSCVMSVGKNWEVILPTTPGEPS